MFYLESVVTSAAAKTSQTCELQSCVHNFCVQFIANFYFFVGKIVFNYVIFFNFFSQTIQVYDI